MTGSHVAVIGRNAGHLAVSPLPTVQRRSERDSDTYPDGDAERDLIGGRAERYPDARPDSDPSTDPRLV
ncbi:hypothetical protein [Halostella pelagica]|uniref:hypothetical protein n=1 Tax=Halostella pelagica TaxID=2583824 RepID=UPI00138735E1|nr:hypothetical protein [Halostella pelagica]